MNAGDVVGGRYVLVAPNENVGIPGMWEAIDGKTQNRVSIRVVDAAVFGREGARAAEKFRATARRLHQLPHPRIPRILDVHAEGESGPPYLVMEWVDGVRWSERRRRNPRRDCADDLCIVMRLCEALTPLHDRGIAHRAASPESVLLERLSPRGRESWIDVRLIDFDFMEQRRDGRTRLGDSDGLTGAIEYMAPEQFEGGAIDARADVWAIGIVLYETISGGVPFSGRTRFETMASILRDEVPPLPVETDVPGALLALVWDCLRRDPQERPASARAIRDALRAIAAAHPGLVADSIRDDLPVAPPAKSSDAASITRLGGMHWNFGASVDARPDSTDSAEAPSKIGGLAARVVAFVSAIAAVAATGWALTMRGPATFAHRLSIDSDAVGATLAVQGVRRLALSGPSAPDALELPLEPEVQNVEVRCGSQVLHRVALDFGTSQTLPVVMHVGTGAPTSCESFDEARPPASAAGAAPAPMTTPPPFDAGVDAGMPWHDCVGIWRGWDGGTSFLVTVLDSPDSQRRIVRLNYGGASYSSRSLELRDGQWRSWLGDGSGGGFGLRLTCGPNRTGDGSISDGTAYHLRRDAVAP